MPNPTTTEAVNHPAHYGGGDNPYEHIKVSRAWGLNYELGNATKYICRAGKKNDAIEDLKKAAWYVHAEIQRRDPSYTPPQEFKEYVHKVLDSWGVPVDPDPIIGEIKDCRIGRRLRWLKDNSEFRFGAGYTGRAPKVEKVPASPCG